MTRMAEKIRLAREAKGLTQEAFAEAVGVEPPSVSRWENGVNEPKGKLPKIAQVLGKPVEWFQEDANQDEIQQLKNDFVDLRKYIESAENRVNEALGIVKGENQQLIMEIIKGLGPLNEDQLRFVLEIIKDVPRLSSLGPLSD